MIYPNNKTFYLTRKIIEQSRSERNYLCDGLGKIISGKD